LSFSVESKIQNPKSEGARRAVFVDRDGTLMEEVNFCKDPADVRAIPGAAKRLAHLRRMGWAVVVITNQSGIGRGIIKPEEYEAVHAELLRQIGGEIDGAYMAADVPPHITPRRKPGIGMIEEAVRDLGLTLEGGYFIGDKTMDVQCGHNAGLKSILVHTGHGKKHIGCGADLETRDVVEALDWIIKREA
jgi:D-glycero-D-manno-heptose 1,7-bisphosphate phosphatase